MKSCEKSCGNLHASSRIDAFSGAAKISRMRAISASYRERASRNDSSSESALGRNSVAFSMVFDFRVRSLMRNRARQDAVATPSANGQARPVATPPAGRAIPSEVDMK